MKSCLLQGQWGWLLDCMVEQSLAIAWIEQSPRGGEGAGLGGVSHQDSQPLEK